MKNLNYKKSDIQKITVKGLLSTDGSFVTYIDDNKDERTIEVSKLFAPMLGKEIAFSLGLKEDEDCSKELEGEDE